MAFTSFVSLSRSLAVMTAAGALAFGLPAAAQQLTDSMKKPPAAAAATSSKPETVDQRIATLKTALKVTPEQEPKWQKVADVMRDNASKMDKLVQEKRAKQAKLNAIDDLIRGLSSYSPAAVRAVSFPEPGKENAEVVVDLRYSAHS